MLKGLPKQIQSMNDVEVCLKRFCDQDTALLCEDSNKIIQAKAIS